MDENSQEGSVRGQILEASDIKILDAVQQSVPLVRRPFLQLAQQLDLTEQNLIDRLKRIKYDHNLISQISAIFETKRLGYASALIAAKYAPDQVDGAAMIVCEHPGVSHCYLRTCQYNLWYTLAVPPDGQLDLNTTAAKLSQLSRAESYHVLESTKVYKVGVRLPLCEQDANEPQQMPSGSADLPEEKLELTEQSKQLVRTLQKDLPIEPEPFDRIASEAGMDADELLATGVSYLSRGIMRRYAAVLRHRRVGFTVNCMTVWRAEEEDVDRAGAVLAGFAEVTHCYRRPTWPGWPYNLYAMVHCRSEEACRALLDRMQQATGVMDMSALYSLREYKKVRLRYFTPEFAQWEEQYAK